MSDLNGFETARKLREIDRNMLLRQVILRRGIPFDVAYPEDVLEFRPEVIEAMEEAKRISRDPNVKGYTDVNQMFKEILEDGIES